jgi:hypothetical protein
MAGIDGKCFAHLSTPGRRWRAKRNAVICVAARYLPQSAIADVLDLTRSQVSRILKRERAAFAELQARQGVSGRGGPRKVAGAAHKGVPTSHEKARPWTR